MEFSELVLKRRSVRAYTGELLTRAQAETILDAGLRAPNACNYQSWHFYALVGRDAAELLFPEVYSAPWFEKIGMAVVATVDDAGLVTAVAPGECEIVVRTPGGLEDRCAVTVRN